MKNPASETDRILGARLRLERERARLTQEEVALSLRLPRQAISEIENGHRSVSAHELFQLCRLFALDPGAFFRVSDGVPVSEPIFFRADRLGSTGRAAIGRFRNRCVEYRDLEVLLGDYRAVDIRPVKTAVTSFEEAWRLAEEERKRLDLGALPAWVLLDALEERVGIKILAESTEWTLSGACLSGETGPAILVNSAHVPPRVVFTLAHEYFHLLAPAAAGLSHDEGTVCGSDPSTKSRADQLADQFAAELLMPKDTIGDRLAALSSVPHAVDAFTAIRLAAEFGVSMQAMLYRLGNLKKLGRGAPKELYDDPDVRVEDQQFRSGCRVPPADPQRFRMLAVRAYFKDELSRGRLAELLGVDFAEVEEHIALFSRAEEIDDRLGHAH